MKIISKVNIPQSEYIDILVEMFDQLFSENELNKLDKKTKLKFEKIKERNK